MCKTGLAMLASSCGREPAMRSSEAGTLARNADSENAQDREEISEWIHGETCRIQRGAKIANFRIAIALERRIMIFSINIIILIL